jgi:hypothetical protein
MQSGGFPWGYDWNYFYFALYRLCPHQFLWAKAPALSELVKSYNVGGGRFHGWTDKNGAKATPFQRANWLWDHHAAGYWLDAGFASVALKRVDYITVLLRSDVRAFGFYSSVGRHHLCVHILSLVVGTSGFACHPELGRSHHNDAHTSALIDYDPNLT